MLPPQKPDRLLRHNDIFSLPSDCYLIFNRFLLFARLCVSLVEVKSMRACVISWVGKHPPTLRMRNACQVARADRSTAYGNWFVNWQNSPSPSSQDGISDRQWMTRFVAYIFHIFIAHWLPSEMARNGSTCLPLPHFSPYFSTLSPIPHFPCCLTLEVYAFICSNIFILLYFQNYATTNLWE